MSLFKVTEGVATFAPVGGVGWGEVINGGFGMLLDGSEDADRRLKSMLFWDVNNGISRRSWARNEGAILYADAEGRMKIAEKFNQAIKNGEIGPVVLGRDHHDVSGTDSPYRETSNIYDGSRFKCLYYFGH